MHLGNIDGIGPPDVILPGDAVLKSLGKLVLAPGFDDVLMHAVSSLQRKIQS